MEKPIKKPKLYYYFFFLKKYWTIEDSKSDLYWNIRKKNFFFFL